MSERWSWGVPALPEQERYAELVRELTSMILSVEDSSPALDALLEALSIARRDLQASVPADLRPRVGAHADGPGRVYLDHTYDIGSYNPMFPLFRMNNVSPSHASGVVTFPLCYEAAPGIVNGGFIGVFFDHVVLQHNAEAHSGGVTRRLDIRFRRPVPVEVELAFDVERTLDERSVRSTVRLLRDDEVLAVGEADALRVDQLSTIPVSPRRLTDPVSNHFDRQAAR